MPTTPSKITRARGLDLNCCRSSFPRPPLWRKRRPLMRKVLDQVRPSWMTVQECTKTQRRDMTADLAKITGHRWKSYAYVNVGILWDDEKWKPVKLWHGWMQGGGRRRYCAMACLERRSTGERIILVSAHLSVKEPRAATWRKRQAHTLDRFIDRVKAATGCKRVLIGADLNSASMAPAGVRGVLAKLGYRSMFVAPEKVKNATLDTHKGYGKPISKTDNSRRIDDVLISGPITTYRPAIVETGNATDHRGLQISVEF